MLLAPAPNSSAQISATIIDSTLAVIGSDFYGIQYHEKTYNDPVALDKLSEIPLSSIRIWAYPSEFHPQPGQWDWAALDSTINEVVNAGYEPVVCLFQAEDWYTGSPENPWWNDDTARTEWQLAATELANRYNSSVSAFIVFDEVNYLDPAGDYYMSMDLAADVYLEAARAIKTVDENLIVGGPSGFAGWENGQWANRVLGHADGSDHLNFVSSNIFASWNKDDTNDEIMDRTIWYEEAPRKILEMIGGDNPPALLLDAFNVSALWTIDGTPNGQLWTDPRNVSTFGGVFQTAALLHAAGGGFDNVFKWETLGGFGILSWFPDFDEQPPYYAWKLLHEHGRLASGARLVQATTSATPRNNLPHHSGQNVSGFDVQPFGIADAEGMSLILINKYEDDVTVSVDFPEDFNTYSIYRFDSTRHALSLEPIYSGTGENTEVSTPGMSVTIVKMSTGAPTSLPVSDVPEEYPLTISNHPNPFAKQTNVNVQTQEFGTVSIDVFAIDGRRVFARQGVRPPGEHTYSFVPPAAGIYVVRGCLNGVCGRRLIVGVE